MSDTEGKRSEIDLGIVSSYRVDALKGDNWLAWKTRIECILHMLDLFEYVEGQVPKPDPENKNETRTWSRYDNFARFLIMINISDEEMTHIYECKDAAEMWRNLNVVHEAMRLQATIDGLRTLVRVKWVPRDMSLPEHFNEMKRLNNKLLQLGHRASDSMLQSVLATSLPESWDNFTQSYVQHGTEEGTGQFTSEQLISIIIGEWERRKAHGQLSSDSLPPSEVMLGKRSRQDSVSGKTNDLSRFTKKNRCIK